MNALWQFLQTYGIWIFLGIFFMLMVRMHGQGGCGMGMSHQDDERTHGNGDCGMEMGHNQRNEPLHQHTPLSETTRGDYPRVVPLERKYGDFQQPPPSEQEG